jgi:hypothetical protein
MNVVKHRTYPESMFRNPEILDVDVWFSDGSFCRARLCLSHKDLMEVRPVYELGYIVENASELKSSHKEAVKAIENYLFLKRNEMALFIAMAIVGTIGLGILIALGLFL